MKAVAISRDTDISALICLELSGHFECDCVTALENATEYSLVICDLDTAEPPKYINGRIVTFSRVNGKARLLRPFLISDLLALCLADDGETVCVDERNESVIIGGVTTTLTHREFLLFNALFCARGETVCCENLLSVAFDGATDRGLLGVYIHYLRNKLEHGRRLIYSRRGEGYYLDLEGYTVC